MTLFELGFAAISAAVSTLPPLGFQCGMFLAGSILRSANVFENVVGESIAVLLVWIVFLLCTGSSPF